VKDAGLAARTTFRNRTRSMRRRAHAIGAWLRRRNEDAREELYALTAEMVAIATATVAEVADMVRNARRTLARRGISATSSAWAALAELESLAATVETIAAQARTRIAGRVPDGTSRVVSLHDPDARPIRKGRIGKPVEFGCKAQVTDNAEGIVGSRGDEWQPQRRASAGTGHFPHQWLASAGSPRSWPPTAAMKRPESTPSSKHSACAMWSFPARAGPGGARQTAASMSPSDWQVEDHRLPERSDQYARKVVWLGVELNPGARSGLQSPHPRFPAAIWTYSGMSKVRKDVLFHREWPLEP
jgi:hypothetical protein